MRRILFLAALALAAPPCAVAAADPALLCDEAAQAASRETGVPLDVLEAIALAESGRPARGRQRPWPWTVNFGGQGYWFASRAEAERAVLERQAGGSTNFDLGCFQLNHRWHGKAFPDVSGMLDPLPNARYAARFLARLFQETGTWPDAAAAYHSRTPVLADRYRARFARLHAGLGSGAQGPLAAEFRRNGFPLLRAGGGGALGSLVPALAGGARLIGTAP